MFVGFFALYGTPTVASMILILILGRDGLGPSFRKVIIIFSIAVILQWLLGPFFPAFIIGLLIQLCLSGYLAVRLLARHQAS